MREGDRTLNEVLGAVAQYFAISREHLVSGRGARQPRSVAMYLALRLTRRSLLQIGRRFGGVSSTNVMHAVYSIERDMTGDAEFATEIAALKALLLAR